MKSLFEDEQGEKISYEALEFNNEKFLIILYLIANNTLYLFWGKMFYHY